MTPSRVGLRSTTARPGEADSCACSWKCSLVGMSKSVPAEVNRGQARRGRGQQPQMQRPGGAFPPALPAQAARAQIVTESPSSAASFDAREGQPVAPAGLLIGRAAVFTPSGRALEGNRLIACTADGQEPPWRTDSRALVPAQ